MKNYTITEEQIIKLDKEGLFYVREWFPEAFKKELEIGKWYKNKNLPTTIINCQVFNEREKYGYGFHLDLYADKWGLLNYEDYTEATEDEVRNALINEAKKRGYTSKNTKCLKSLSRGNKINENYNFGFFFNDNVLYSQPKGDGGFCLFENGIWAEIIKEEITLNFQQIADKFGINVEQLRITKL